ALEEVGYARCPLPVHGGLVQPLAASALLGDAAQVVVATHLLGGGRFEFAMHGDSGLPGAENVSLQAEQADGAWRLSGTVRHLRYADSAGYLLVAGRAGRGRL